MSKLFTLENLRTIMSLDRKLNVFWRHDIDYNLKAAVSMAFFEKELGVQSIYYFRATADEYSPEDIEFRNCVDAVRQLGHGVGCHVDLFTPRRGLISDRKIRNACETQIAMLRLPYRITAVSFHAPPADALWRSVEGFAHAMSPLWEGRYWSDSRGIFGGHGESNEHAQRRVLDRLMKTKTAPQVNLHPEWWFLPKAEADAMRIREAGNP